jgi:hypothetical protein
LIVDLLVILLPFLSYTDYILHHQTGPKRDEVTGGWRKLHNEELDNFYSSPSIIIIIKSSRMRWAGHVARMGKKRNAYRILMGNQKERDHYEDLDVGERIILKWILDRQDGVVWTELIRLRTWTSGWLL